MTRRSLSWPIVPGGPQLPSPCSSSPYSCDQYGESTPEPERRRPGPGRENRGARPSAEAGLMATPPARVRRGHRGIRPGSVGDGTARAGAPAGSVICQALRLAKVFLRIRGMSSKSYSPGRPPERRDGADNATGPSRRAAGRRINMAPRSRVVSRKDVHMADATDRAIERSCSRTASSPLRRSSPERAHVSSPSVYRKADRDLEKFWARFAEELEWYRPWKKVLDWKPPHAKWFVGGKLNVIVNCLDRHVATAPRATRRRSSGKASRATAARSPTATCTARSASSPTCSSRSASTKGDRVAIYLPLIPEAGDRDARLRAHRRGPLRRLRRLQRRVAARPHQRRAGAGCSITADGGYRRGQVVPLKQIADEALERHARRSSTSSSCSAAGAATPRRTCKEGRDHWWHRLMQDARAVRASPSRWTPRTCSTSSTLGHDRQAEGHRPHHRRLPRRHVRDDASWSSTSRTTTSTGARPTSAGSPATATSSTARSRNGATVRDVRRRARLAREGPLLGRSSSATASRSSTRRRRRSARS